MTLPLWVWILLTVAGYVAGGVSTLFLHSYFLPAEDRAKDESSIDPIYVRQVFFFWPFFLLVELPMAEFGKFLFSTVMVANEKASIREQKEEIRKLRDLHEVKEEETYPIPHTTEAQWRKSQGTHCDEFYEWLTRGGK